VGRLTELLEKWARRFFERLERRHESLAKAGMDEELLEQLKGMMEDAGG